MARSIEIAISPTGDHETSSLPRPKAAGLANAGDLAAAFKALGDPTRVQVMSLLLSAGPEGLCVCDIVACFLLGQPTISHHLGLLRDAGLVSTTRKGLWVFYAARPARLAGLGINLPLWRNDIRRSRCCDEDGSTSVGKVAT